MSFNIVILLLYLRFFRNRSRLTPIRNEEIDRVQSERDLYKAEAEKYKLEAEFFKQENVRLTNELHQLQQVKEIAETDDRFNVNDFISRLPDLCINEIFKRLPRKDIFNMSMISSRFFPLANEKSLDGIKWEKGCLEFYKTANGYHFRLAIDRINLPNTYDCDIEFDYGIIKNEDGEIIEKKRMGPFDDNDEPSYLYDQNSIHSWPIPDIFLLNLAQLIRQRNVSFILLFAFPIDAEFYSNLSKILKGHSVDDITIYYPILNETISEMGRQSFANFIKGMRRVVIDSSQFLINEKFLREIKGGNLIYFSICLELHPIAGMNDRDDEDISHYFRPTQSILPYLIGYDVLGVLNMIIDRNWLAALCMMAIESLDKTTEKKSTLHFTIDRAITGDEISLRLRHNYEYSLVNGEHVIKRIDGRMARIKMINYEVSGHILHGISMQVHE